MQHPIIPDNVRRTFYDAHRQEATFGPLMEHINKEKAQKPDTISEAPTSRFVFWSAALIGIAIAALPSILGTDDSAAHGRNKSKL